MNGFSKGLRLRLSLLTVVMLMAALLGPTSALAAADTFTVSQSFPIDIVVFVSCANGGAGELVELTGSLHETFHVTFDGRGGFHISVIDNPQGISGTGLTTGAKYQGTGETRDGFNGVVGFEETFVNNFKIIGQGPGNNFLVHDNLHITVNANGTLTVSIDNFSVECK
jgi:hypothetical protein